MAKTPEPVVVPGGYPDSRGTLYTLLAPVSRLVVSCMVFAIRAYRLVLSPWIGNQCRFHPTCSRYAEEAILTHGAGRGVLLAARRLGKCHPWHEGGCDPVPPPRP